MKIGILSDTHGSLKYFKKAMDYFKDCDYIIHGGDVLYHGPRNPLPEDYNPKELAEFINTLDNIFITKGNCDSDVDQMVINHEFQSPYMTLSFGPFNIFVCHGYRDSMENLIALAKSLNCNVFISGHTHLKILENNDSFIQINPGSTSLPKDSCRSICTLEDHNAKLINLDTLEVIKEIKL